LAAASLARVFVDIAPRKDCVHQDPLPFNHEQDSQTSNPDLALRASVYEMVGILQWILGCIYQRFVDPHSDGIVESL
jgi:hypothetical protein